MQFGSRQEINILYVDDHPSITDPTGMLLKHDDDQFIIETATRAEEGLQQISDRPPDCVVSGFNMPGINGIEFLKTVRERHPDLPFILFISKGSETVASEAISANVTGYLEKESGSEQYERLANRIRNAVSARRETRRADRQEQLMRSSELAGDTGGFEIDLDRGELLLTDGTRRLVGLPDDTHITLKEAIELYHPDDQADIRQTITRAAESCEQTFGTWRLQAPDGNERFIDVTFTPATENGDVTTLRGAVHDVTEHKKRQQNLTRTRDLMANIEELADAGAWEYDSDTDKLVMTGGACGIYGLEPDSDLTLEEAFKPVHPANRKRLIDQFKKCLEAGEPYEADLRLTTTEGARRWVTVRGERVVTSESNHVVRGYIRNITEQKRREQQLTELNHACEDLATAETKKEVAQIGTRAAKQVLNLPANWVHLSEADDTRLTPVAQTDEALSLIGNVQPLPVADSIAGRVYQRGEPTVLEDVRQDPDVHSSETELRGHVYLPLANHGVLIVGSKDQATFDQQDLTLGELLAGSLVAAFDRIDRQQAAHQRRDQLSLFFEESPLGAIQWDDEFQFKRVNRRAEEILGYSQAELYGESWDTIVTDDDSGRVSDVVDTLLAANGGRNVINNNVRKDDEILTCEWHNRAVTDNNGNVQSVFSKFQDITDRESRKRELQEYETIIKSLSDAVYVIDEEGRFTYVNDEFVELAGYERKTILGSLPSLIKDEDSVRQAEQQLGRLLSSDGPDTVSFEVTVHPQDAEPVVCEDHMAVLPYEGDQFNGSVGTLRDITDRKKRKRELQNERNRFQSIFDNAFDTMVIADDDGQYIEVNDRATELFGLSEQELVGKSIRDFAPEGFDFKTAWEEFQQSQRDRETFPLVRPDGTERFVEYSAATDILPGQQLSVLRDVTDRRQRERRFRALVEESNDLISVVDTDGSYQYVAPSVKRILGYDHKDMIGETAWNYVHPDDRDELVETFEHSVANPDTNEVAEYRVRHADGSWHWMEARGNNQFDTPAVGGYVVNNRDITERRERQQQSERLGRVLRHNLRNDLNVIRVSAELIRNKTTNTIASFAEQIIETCDQLIATAEKERETAEILQSPPAPEEFTLKQLFRTVVSNLSSEYPDAKIAIDCDDDVTIQATKQFPQAIKELVTNAIIHNDSDSPEVIVAADQTAENIRIEIADTGPCIPEIERKVLSEDEERTPLKHGSGLGLWLVQLLVSRSGGSITLEENSPAGNIVALELPG